jgi:transcriptional regulator with XRE-family HTH domain
VYCPGRLFARAGESGVLMTKSRRAEELMWKFGKRLRACRIAAGYEKGAEFARAIGSNDYRYRKYERGETMPPFDTLELISQLTKKSLDFLILGKPDGAE